ncbi:hypothetical protein SNEBB_001576 [Seison nebaliae]|nr:hypothetical protein SNEBB_001576 [Seison nebaliae]
MKYVLLIIIDDCTTKGILYPEPWVEFAGRCYFFSKIPANFTESIRYCYAMSSDLVYIETEREFEWIQRIAWQNAWPVMKNRLVRLETVKLMRYQSIYNEDIEQIRNLIFDVSKERTLQKEKKWKSTSRFKTDKTPKTKIILFNLKKRILPVGYYIGAYDFRGKNDDVYWINNHPSKVRRWGKGEPNDATGSERATALLWELGYLWGDVKEDEELYFICKAPIFKDREFPRKQVHFRYQTSGTPQALSQITRESNVFSGDRCAALCHKDQTCFGFTYQRSTVFKTKVFHNNSMVTNSSVIKLRNVPLIVDGLIMKVGKGKNVTRPIFVISPNDFFITHFFEFKNLRRR